MIKNQLTDSWQIEPASVRSAEYLRQELENCSAAWRSRKAARVSQQRQVVGVGPGGHGWVRSDEFLEGVVCVRQMVQGPFPMPVRIARVGAVRGVSCCNQSGGCGVSGVGWDLRKNCAVGMAARSMSGFSAASSGLVGVRRLPLPTRRKRPCGSCKGLYSRWCSRAATSRRRR